MLWLAGLVGILTVGAVGVIDADPTSDKDMSEDDAGTGAISDEQTDTDILTTASASVSEEGSDEDQVLDGSDTDDTLAGGTGNDSLHGQDSDDELAGESGDDTLVGGNGEDSLE
ncbi:MAG: hypothetical protein ABJ263_20290 [Tateyamaria sp.]|uniref:calcium-binding protein n=1 Tax=Tateyamaria sp. TaxID=1929288 RepID=UPI00327CA5DB